MVDPLRGPKAKVERAKKHIGDVESGIKAFFNNAIVSTFIEPNASGTQDVLKYRISHSIPDEIPAIVGDALNNLRSALDLMMCALAIKNGATNIKDVYFPFAGDKNEFELPATQRKIKKLSPDARAIIHTIKPYNGGNSFLWSLSKLAGMDKHQSLIMIGALRSGSVARLTLSNVGIGLKTISAPTWRSLQNSDVIMEFPAGAKLEGEVEIALQVAFGEVEPVKGQPVLAILQQFSNLVQGMVLACERRFFTGS